MADIFSQFDESELLSLIEDELEGKREQIVLAKLEANPRVKAMVLQMRADRAALRTTEEPEMPRDIMADLEPLLSRPMLFASTTSKPGELRRRHRAARRRRQLPRIAAAAVLLLALGGVIWASSGYITSGFEQIAAAFRDSSGTSVTQDEHGQAIPDRHDRVATNQAPSVSPEDGVLHHFRPEPVPMDQFALAGPEGNSNAKPGGSDNPGTPGSQGVAGGAAAPMTALALVVDADGATSVEQAVRDLLPKLASPAAVVRNYSPKFEGRDIDTAPTGPTMKTGGGASARRNLDAADHGDAGQSAAVYASMKIGQAEGTRELVPSRAEQTRFADYGASHTISVTRSHLNDLLGQLGQVPGLHTRLQLLPDQPNETWAAADAPLLTQMEQRRRIRRILAALEHRAGDPVVMLPVVVRQRAGH